MQMESWICSDSFLSDAWARLPLPSARYTVTEHSSLAVPGGAGSQRTQPLWTLKHGAGTGGGTRLHLFLSQSVTVVGCAAEEHG